MLYRALFFLAFVMAGCLAASPALAQCGCGTPQATYAPVESSYSAYYPSTVTYYAPATEVAYAPATSVSYYAPATPEVTYYAPATPTYSTYYAPAATYTSYYAAPAVPSYSTYYAPATVYYSPYVVGRSVFGAPRVYVPGQPVRNTLKAITP